MSNDDTNEGREPTERVCVRLPVSMIQRIDVIRGPYRNQSSMILEIIGEYLEEYGARKLEQIAQNSDEYRALLAKLRRDLGLPDQPPGAG